MIDIKHIANLSPEKRQLVERLLQKQSMSASRLPIASRDRASGAAPLSFAQQRLWFLDQLEPGSSIYNVPLAVRLSGALDVEALERTLGEVLRRHEALRTTFVTTERRAVQVINPAAPVRLDVEDLSGLGEAEREARARREAPRRRRAAAARRRTLPRCAR